MPKLDADEIAKLHPQVSDWEVILAHHLRRVFTFDDFVGALRFVNRIAEVAEAENHHPNLSLTWGRVEVEIWTHKIDGLAEASETKAGLANSLLLRLRDGQTPEEVTRRIGAAGVPSAGLVTMLIVLEAVGQPLHAALEQPAQPVQRL